MSYGTQSSNGWLLSIIQSCCQTYGWDVTTVIDQPLLILMLMVRQKAYVESNGKGFTLMQQEELKEQQNIPWAELVRMNREKLAKQMANLPV